MKLDELPEKEKQPTLVGGMPIFDWRLVHLIDDEEDDMGEKKILNMRILLSLNKKL